MISTVICLIACRCYLTDDRTRVKLIDGHSNSDGYINASHVKVSDAHIGSIEAVTVSRPSDTVFISESPNFFKQNHIKLAHCKVYLQGEDESISNRYIASQAPLENTLVDFWQMVDEQNVEDVLMLCKLKENGKVSFFSVIIFLQ